MKTTMMFAAMAAGMMASAAIEKVSLKTGWKFTKADDSAIVVDHANYSNEIRKLSAILDRANRGDLSGAPQTTWCRTDFDDSAWTSVRVPHDCGVELPVTGGVGTTLFYILGGVLVFGAMLLLITKKRMKAEK